MPYFSPLGQDAEAAPAVAQPAQCPACPPCASEAGLWVRELTTAVVQGVATAVAIYFVMKWIDPRGA